MKIGILISGSLWWRKGVRETCLGSFNVSRRHFGQVRRAHPSGMLYASQQRARIASTARTPPPREVDPPKLLQNNGITCGFLRF